MRIDVSNCRSMHGSNSLSVSAEIVGRRASADGDAPARTRYRRSDSTTTPTPSAFPAILGPLASGGGGVLLRLQRTLVVVILAI